MDRGGEPLARLRGSQVVYEIEEAETKIGRKESCDIVFPDSRSVSGVHSILEVRSPGEAYLHDLNSLNGCFVNNVRVQNTAQRLSHGDNIRFGYDVQSFRLEFPGMEDGGKAQQGETRRSRSSDQGQDRDTVGGADEGEGEPPTARAAPSARPRSRPASAQPASTHPAHSLSQSPPASRPRPQSSRLARSAALPPRPRSRDSHGGGRSGGGGGDGVDNDDGEGGGGADRPVKHAATMGGAQAELRSLKRMLSRQQFLAKEDEAASQKLLERSSAATDSPALRDRTKREAERIEAQRQRRSEKIRELERRVGEVDALIESGSLPAKPAGPVGQSGPENGSLAFAAATGRQLLRVGSSEAATAGTRAGPAGAPSGHSPADTSGLDFASSLRQSAGEGVGGRTEEYAPKGDTRGSRRSSSRAATRGRSTSRSPARSGRAGSAAPVGTAGSRAAQRPRSQVAEDEGPDPFEGMGGGGDEALPPMLQTDTGEEEEEEDDDDDMFAGMGGGGDEALPGEAAGGRRPRGGMRRSAPGGVGTGRWGSSARGTGAGAVHGRGRGGGGGSRGASGSRSTRRRGRAGGGAIGGSEEEEEEEEDEENEDEDDPFADMGGGGDEALPDTGLEDGPAPGAGRSRGALKVPSAERAARAEGEAQARAESAEQLAAAQREIARLRPLEAEVESLRTRVKESAKQAEATADLRTSLAGARAEVDTERARAGALEKLVASLRAAERAASRRCEEAEREAERLRGATDWARVASEQALQLRSLQSSLAQRAREAKDARRQLAEAVKGGSQGTESLQAFLAEQAEALRTAKAEAEELQRRLALAETQRDRARAELRRASSAGAQRARDQSEDLASLRKQLRERDGKLVALYKQLAVLAASEAPQKGRGRAPGAMVPRGALPAAIPHYYYGGVEKAQQGAITAHAGPAATGGNLQGLSPHGRTRAEAAKLLVRQLRDQAALQGERDELAHKCSALQRQVERMRAEARGAEAAAEAAAGGGAGAGDRGDDALAGLGREDLIAALRELKRDGGARAVAESNQLVTRVQEEAAAAKARAEEAEEAEAKARLDAETAADRVKAGQDELAELQQRVAQLHLLLETGGGGAAAGEGKDDGEGPGAPTSAPTPAVAHAPTPGGTSPAPGVGGKEAAVDSAAPGAPPPAPPAEGSSAGAGSAPEPSGTLSVE